MPTGSHKYQRAVEEEIYEEWAAAGAMLLPGALF